MARVTVEYECPNTGKATNDSDGEVYTDVHGDIFYSVDECPVCGDEHYISL